MTECTNCEAKVFKDRFVSQFNWQKKRNNALRTYEPHKPSSDSPIE